MNPVYRQGFDLHDRRISQLIMKRLKTTQHKKTYLHTSDIFNHNVGVWEPSRSLGTLVFQMIELLGLCIMISSEVSTQLVKV